MPPGFTNKPLLAAFLLLQLLGSCWAQQESENSGVCLAVVEYATITGVSVKTNQSQLFRGVVRIQDQIEDWKPRNSQLSWSFAREDTILGGDTVFRQNSGDSKDVGEIMFTTSLTEGKQSVAMNYFADDRIVQIGFVVQKGAAAPDMDINVRRSIGLPVSLEYNGLLCEEYIERVNPQFQSTQDSTEVTRGSSIVELEYLPIEFSNLRFYTDFTPNFAILSFRLLNNGSAPIDLSDLVLEYWFHANSANALFNSHCMATSVTDCSQIKVSVEPGFQNVSGAHYKVEIGFRKEAGVLVPDKQLLPQAVDDGGNQVNEWAPTMIEVLLNITSNQIFTQLDVTKDYSFLNTTILDGSSNLPMEIVPRAYALNPKMPVLMNGEIIFGNRPNESQEKVPLDTSNQNDCWYKNRHGQKCDMLATYCCQEEQP